MNFQDFSMADRIVWHHQQDHTVIVYTMSGDNFKGKITNIDSKDSAIELTLDLFNDTPITWLDRVAIDLDHVVAIMPAHNDHNQRDYDDHGNYSSRLSNEALIKSLDVSLD